MAGSGTPDALPRYPDRRDAPRDLRTADELRAHGYEQLGEQRAALVNHDGTLTALYSTSEARLLKNNLWPRGPKLNVQRAQAGEAAQPIGSSRRVTNPGGSAAAAPGSRPPVRAYGRHPQPPTATFDPQEWLSQLYAEGFVVLDTETTGLGPRAEIIEIAAVDVTGEVLMESKVWPRSGRVPAATTRVHGLTIADLRGAPTWPELLLELEEKLAGRRVLAWNAPFDERMARQSSRLWNLEPRLPTFECAMRAYARARGAGTSMRLERAAQVERVLAAAQEHRSAGDARLVLAVLKRLAEARSVPA
ncbi:MAG: 3'-5' exonuclease [Trueperaceae bacterium]